MFDPTAVSAHVWAAGSYLNGLREMIHRTKFEADPVPLSTLNKLLVALYRTKIDLAFPTVTAIPGVPARVRTRGIDLPHHLGRRFARELRLPFHGSLIRRVRIPEAQASLPRKRRLENLLGVFSAAEDLTGRRILIVDDVVTTGVTLESARTALLECGATEVTCLAVAHTPLDEDVAS
jgi:ComF family protein